jgi:hypothetical protein
VGCVWEECPGCAGLSVRDACGCVPCSCSGETASAATQPTEKKKLPFAPWAAGCCCRTCWLNIELGGLELCATLLQGGEVDGAFSSRRTVAAGPCRISHLALIPMKIEE